MSIPRNHTDPHSQKTIAYSIVRAAMVVAGHFSNRSGPTGSDHLVLTVTRNEVRFLGFDISDAEITGMIARIKDGD